MGTTRARIRWRFLLPVIGLLLIACMSVKAHAADYTMQYNNTYVSGRVSGTRSDYYLLPATASGYVDITYKGSSTKNSYIYICGADKEPMNGQGQLVGGGTSLWRYRVWLSNTTADGAVWVKISPYKKNTVSYQIKAGFSSVAGANVTEPNNRFSRAMVISGDTVYTSAMAQNDYEDYYCFSIASRQKVTITLSSQISRESWPAAITGWSGPFTLSRAPGQVNAALLNSRRVAISNGGSLMTISKAYSVSSVSRTLYSGTLPAGTYYVRVTKPRVSGNNVVSYQNNGVYTLTVKAVTSTAPDDSGKTQSGIVTLSKSSVTLVNGKSYTLTGSVDGKKVSGSTLSWGSSDPSVATVSTTGRIKAVGNGSAIITAGVDGGGTATCTVIVKPAAVANVRLRSVSTTAGKMRILWNKQTGVKGYQIQISASSTFKSGVQTKAVTSASRYYTSFTGLKKNKRYYVRVRAYVTVNGKNYNGSWSSVKSMRLKK